jgi:hypothetical protein
VRAHAASIASEVEPELSLVVDAQTSGRKRLSRSTPMTRQAQFAEEKWRERQAAVTGRHRLLGY